MGKLLLGPPAMEGVGSHSTRTRAPREDTLGWPRGRKPGQGRGKEVSDPRGQRLFSPAPAPPTRRVAPAEHAPRARGKSAVLLMWLQVTSTPNCRTPPEHGNKALHALKEKRDRLLHPRPAQNQPRLAVPHALGGAGEELSPGMPPGSVLSAHGPRRHSRRP